VDAQVDTLDPLGDQHRSWGIPPNEDILWLLDHDIPETWLHTPWPVSSRTVSIERGCFCEDAEGDRAFIFRCTDRDTIIDLIAWHPESNRLASWLGTGFCIGDIDDIYNPATYFAGDALRVHASPIEWLKAARDGIVIARPDLAGAYLGRVQRIAFTNVKLAERIKRQIKKPTASVEILVEADHG
jgi:hypothetical protein